MAFFLHSPTSRLGYGFNQRVAPTWADDRLNFNLLSKSGPIGLQLRASNEGLRRPRVARAKQTNGLPFPSYTGRTKRAHGSMNKERHVCARRRVGEAAGPDGLVSDRTRD